jgi:exopolysaccharide production protein ExoZ
MTNTTKSENRSKHGYIDVLRGIAILLVIMVHSSQAYDTLDPLISKYTAEGARGVQLFFITSALTLMISWNARNDGIRSFYIRRLFRIAPMFWLAIPFFLFLNGTEKSYWAPEGIHFWQVALTFLFVHGFEPQSITSVVPGGWSIAVEMTFYAIFPVLVNVIKTWKSALASFVSAIILADFLVLIVPMFWIDETPAMASNFAFLWFPNQFPCFLLGILVYFIIQKVEISTWLAIALILTAIIVALILPILNNLPIQNHLVFSVVFGVLIFGLANIRTSYLEVTSIRFIGRISYSAYFWHFAILKVIFLAQQNGYDFFKLNDPHHPVISFIILYVFVVILSCIFSWLTYLKIELPFIAIGNRITKTVALKFCKNDVIR